MLGLKLIPADSDEAWCQSSSMVFLTYLYEALAGYHGDAFCEKFIDLIYPPMNQWCPLKLGHMIDVRERLA